jgi:hypothetical protein
MTMKRRVFATLSAGAMGLGLAASAFGQADNTNSLIAPAPTYSQPGQYDASRQPYRQEPRRPRDATPEYGRALTPYEAERAYGHPYPSGYPYANDPADSRYQSPARIGGPGLSVGNDSNPNDYETGIYNPKH